MTKRVVLSPEAQDDISEILDYLDANVSPSTALRFFEAVQAATGLIAESPSIGALRSFNRPALQGMRMLVLTNFPNHLLFYQEASEVIEIIRILDGRRNLQTLFT